MTKAELIIWLASLPNSSPELDQIAAIRRGDDVKKAEEPQLNLKETSLAVKKHFVWLCRLGVPEACGVWIAGRRSYKVSEVMKYLKSDACRARIAELREQRKAKEGRK